MKKLLIAIVASVGMASAFAAPVVHHHKHFVKHHHHVHHVKHHRTHR